MRKYLICCLIAGLVCPVLNAQVPPQYEVATWHNFCKAAITFTFDDYTPNQIPVAVPLFDKFGFKATFYPIISWHPDWDKLAIAVKNGHEVGSHTINHPNLSSVSDTLLRLHNEVVGSQSFINERIPGNQCRTIAYPYCAANQAVKDFVRPYYLGARICSGQIEPATPADFMAISSIGCGQLGINNSVALNAKAIETLSKNGWCTYLFHGVNNDGGYSPVADSVLNAHLSFLKKNQSSYWVATFATVIKYIRERNALTVHEIANSATRITVLLSDTLSDKSVFDVALTVKRQLPVGWKTAYVYRAGQMLPSHITRQGATRFVQFDFVPAYVPIIIAKKKINIK